MQNLLYIRPAPPAAMLLGALAVLFIIGCGEGDPSSATEEHEHAALSVTRWTDAIEVFLEHPPMVADQSSEPWALHLTQLDGYEPIREGTVTLRFNGPNGTVYSTQSEEPVRPGIFAPAPVLPAAGTYQLLIEVDSPQVTGRVFIGDVSVYASEDSAPHKHAESSGNITFLKEQQWEADFAVARARERSMPYAIEMSGEIVPAAEHMARVSAPVSGLVRAPSNLQAPTAGDRVRAGQTMAVLSPTEGANSYTQLKSRVERLQREVSRLERLYEVRAVPEKRLVEARHELRTARSALESMGGSQGEGYSYAVRAPISGVVDERQLSLGDRVEPGTSLYTIINPDRVWLKMQVPAEYAQEASNAEGATFRPEGSNYYRQADEVVSVGNAIDPETRTLPVTLAVNNGNGQLKIGMYADGKLLVGEERTGVAIPNEAIQREDGTPVVYIQTAGESFERRIVRLGPSDGQYTLVENGVDQNEFVVTQGAYQVHLASLNTEDVGGHGHPH